MPRGRVEFIQEIADQAELLLPRGVKVASRTPFGGVVRMEIDGEHIKDGCSYQLVITDEPTRRVIELKESPLQDA